MNDQISVSGLLCCYARCISPADAVIVRRTARGRISSCAELWICVQGSVRVRSLISTGVRTQDRRPFVLLFIIDKILFQWRQCQRCGGDNGRCPHKTSSWPQQSISNTHINISNIHVDIVSRSEAYSFGVSLCTRWQSNDGHRGNTAIDLVQVHFTHRCIYVV